MQIRRSAEKEEGNVWQQLMEVLPRARYFTFPSSCPPCVLYFIHSTTESQAVDALTIEIHTSTTLNKTSKVTDIHINKTNLYYSIFYSQSHIIQASKMPLQKKKTNDRTLYILFFKHEASTHTSASTSTSSTSTTTSA